LRSALQTAEASQRGFLLSNNEIYLSPYDSAKALAERKARAHHFLGGIDGEPEAVAEIRRGGPTRPAYS
jgi:hypothetical protein